MTPNQNARVKNGTPKICHIQISQERVNPKSSQCSSIFWSWRSGAQVICALRSNSLLDLLSRSPRTAKKRVLHVWPDIANVTLHCRWGSFWRPIALRWFSSPCIHQISILFLRIKNCLQEHYFETTNNIQKSVTNTLKDFTDEDFHQCFQRWKECLEWCVASVGNCLGGDHIEMQNF